MLTQSLSEVEKAATSMLRPAMVLDMLASFTAFATQKGKQRIKIIARYQQVDGVNKIIARVVAGQPRKGLLWHFQGSGKSLLMLFAARKLRLHPALKNPTVLVVVDRIDLDTIRPGGLEMFEAMAFGGHNWWHIDDLLTSTDSVLPRRLREFLPDLVAGRLPDTPLDITPIDPSIDF